MMRNFKLTFPTKIGNKFLSPHGCNLIKVCGNVLGLKVTYFQKM